ncbi:MAG TPA: 2-oxoglutarate dehydrogenase complex dihydrolipoyllysine-residue succinyltransferase [Ktedonobacteraceae bacterium]|nr:2-oxoglutarate dehydrogenase complex dihydrolipoyllysine-residue succinyltransferase [Ktedonobacteraceae bacterium]
MSVEIRVPSLGESIVDAVIASWLKKEGESVKQGETLLELETDKINVEVAAEQDGVLQQISKHEGDVVAVGDVIGMIGEGAAAQAQAQPAEAVQKETPAPVQASTESLTTQRVDAPQALNGQRQSETPVPSGRDDGGQRPPTPLARRIAAEHNVDLTQVRGQSVHGRVTKDDVISYLEHSSQQSAPSQAPVAAQTPAPASQAVPVAAQASTPAAPVTNNPLEQRVRLSRRRQTIAQRLVEAQHTAAMLTTFNEIDMSAVMELRSRRKDAFKERHNVSLGFMSFFTKATIGALKAYPRLNAEIQGTDMILKQHYDIGVAVGAEEGLVVPVVRDADRKSFAEIESEISDLAKRVRSNTLTLAELQGGTFTITNGGVFGSMLSTPILNGPQVGILGMHKIEQRPVVVDGQIVIRPMMYVALSYDHRIVDGREAVLFLVKLKELVEDPEALLLEG